MADGLSHGSANGSKYRTAIRNASRSGRIRRESFSTHAGQSWEAPEAGEVFMQADLLKTLQKWSIAEQEAL